MFAFTVYVYTVFGDVCRRERQRVQSNNANENIFISLGICETRQVHGILNRMKASILTVGRSKWPTFPEAKPTDTARGQRRDKVAKSIITLLTKAFG